MMGKGKWRWAMSAFATLVLLLAGGTPAIIAAASPTAQTGTSSNSPAWTKKYLHPGGSLYCGGVASFNCVDIGVGGASAASAGHTPWYVGHDEPSVMFYSNKAGSGNNNHYLLRLPADPVQQPSPSGSGATWNFQLHPAFWFGMVLCDTQSYPETNPTCTPDSDTNIANSSNPTSPGFIGKHAGSAYMELQFYPPGWTLWPVGVSCAANQWCAALNIDSYDASTSTANNAVCLNTVSVEPVNFAFITRDGKPQAPPDPVHATLATYTPNPTKDLYMNPGDRIGVAMHDTASGFQVVITDFTTGQSGSMTASAANGFGQVLFQPTSNRCNVAPYSFHPMYSTSGPSTRVPWAAHSYNVAFADEIGHFEYCNGITTSGLAAGYCDAPAGLDAAIPDPNPLGSQGFLNDDYYCLPASSSSLVKIGGCLGSDGDFDGPEYANNWPGTRKHGVPQPIRFTSPLFNGNQRYSQVAFETDLPRIEYPDFSPTNNCNQRTGTGCVDPPNGPNGKPVPFYPIFTTSHKSLGGGRASATCTWQLGGAQMPATTNTFGGTAQKEYGSLLRLLYAAPGTSTQYLYNDFRQVLPNNPC